MIAAAIRQEAARVAHDNTVRKRNAMFGVQFRTDVETMFRRRSIRRELPDPQTVSYDTLVSAVSYMIESV